MSIKPRTVKPKPVNSADSVDFLRSDRPYRKAWPRDAAVDYIRKKSGEEFDPQVVDAFLRMEK
jgi:HD-GYP domain-containing protein (c-di-GMP phosphodiesterase class II)